MYVCVSACSCTRVCVCVCGMYAKEKSGEEGMEVDVDELEQMNRFVCACWCVSPGWNCMNAANVT